MMIFSQSVYDNPLMNNTHNIPIAEISEVTLMNPYQIEPIAEIKTVCPNCGSVVWNKWGNFI